MVPTVPRVNESYRRPWQDFYGSTGVKCRMEVGCCGWCCRRRLEAVVVAGGCGSCGTVVLNELLSVSSHSAACSRRSRTPHALCVREHAVAARAKRTHLLFGSADAEHLSGQRPLRPVQLLIHHRGAKSSPVCEWSGLGSSRSLGGKEGGGLGAGTWGSCWFPPPRNRQQT